MKYLILGEIGLGICIVLAGVFESSLWLWGTLFLGLPISVVISIIVLIKVLWKFWSKKKIEIIWITFLIFNSLLFIGITYWFIWLSQQGLQGFMTIG